MTVQDSVPKGVQPSNVLVLAYSSAVVRIGGGPEWARIEVVVDAKDVKPVPKWCGGAFDRQSQRRVDASASV